MGSEAVLIVRWIGLGFACALLAGCSSQWRGEFTWAIVEGGVSMGKGDGTLSGEERSDGTLVLEPLTYIRGRSIPHQFMIVDEAQNLSPLEVKTIITRAAEGTKIVFTGDIFQIDTPYLDSQSNGLSYMIDRMQGNELYAHINLEKGERSELANVASQLL